MSVNVCFFIQLHKHLHSNRYFQLYHSQFVSRISILNPYFRFIIKKMARRIAKSAIDWGKFLEYIPKDELANFQTFKVRHVHVVCMIFCFQIIISYTSSFRTIYSIENRIKFNTRLFYVIHLFLTCDLI